MHLRLAALATLCTWATVFRSQTATHAASSVSGNSPKVPRDQEAVVLGNMILRDDEFALLQGHRLVRMMMSLKLLAL